MGSFTFGKRKKAAVFGMTGGKCWYCGVQCDCDGLEMAQFTIDHLDPQGGNDLENLRPCCRSCNAAKGARSLERFRVNRMVPSGCRLNGDQIKFLQCLGVDMTPYLTIGDNHKFWFETQGEECG